MACTGRSPAPVSDAIRKQIIGDEVPIICRPADMLEPSYDRMKAEAEKAGLVKKEEDVLTYIMYPAIAPTFLKGERQAELDSRKTPWLCPPATTGSIPDQMEVEVDGEVFSVRIVSVGGNQVQVTTGVAPESTAGRNPGGIRSNMQGMVLQVMVHRGATVKKGDTLIVLEAMKMENPIHSPVDGKVTEIFVDTGDVVQNGDVLLVVQ